MAKEFIPFNTTKMKTQIQDLIDIQKTLDTKPIPKTKPTDFKNIVKMDFNKFLLKIAAKCLKRDVCIVKDANRFQLVHNEDINPTSFFFSFDNTVVGEIQIDYKSMLFKFIPFNPK